MYFSRRQSFRVFGAVGCLFTLSLWGCGTSAADWREQLFTDAPSKWSTLEQYYSKMEVSFRTIITIPKEGKPFPEQFIGTTYYDVRVKGDWMAYTMHDVGEDSSGKRVDTTNVRGVNALYVFHLAKTTPDTESFVLTRFQPIGDRESNKALVSTGAMSFTAAYRDIQIGRLFDVIKDPRFNIANVHSLQRDGKEVVQFEYNFREDTPDKQASSQAKESWTQHGVVLVDPKRYWCILRTHFDNRNWIGDETVEYGDDMDGYPIPRRRTHSATQNKSMANRLTIDEFDKIVHREIPDSEFTLSAFGMPELPLPGAQKPNMLWRWLIGIGIALGVLAVFFRVYVKKRQGKLAT